MLAKQYRLRKNRDFESVFKKGKTLSGKYFFLKVQKNDLQINRFGFIVGKKITNKAVLRNKIKRRLREVVKENLDRVKLGFDIVIVAKPEILDKNYQQIKNDLENLLQNL